MTVPTTVTEAWAGIDLGTQSIRCALFASDGTMLGAASRPVASVRDGVRHTQDPRAWLDAVREATREAIAAAGDVRVRGLAVSGTSGTVVPVDDRGRPTGEAIMYDDARGRSALHRVAEAGAELWRSLGYRMQASWALPTIVHMIDERELAPGELVAHQPDVVVSWLTGARATTDTSHALKTGADLRTATWPDDVLTALGVDPAILPALALPGEEIGRVGEDAATRTGLPVGCPVIAGMTDGCAAQIAAGALGTGDWNSVLGTTLVVKGAADALRVDPSGAVYAHRAPFGAGWWPGGASSTGAGAVSEWLAGEDLAARTVEAARLGTPAEPSYPLVGAGERFPFVAADARGFFAADAADSPAARLSAIAHGVACLERMGFELLAGLGYDVSGRIVATGGGSRNPWWVKLRADMLGRRVSVPAVGEGSIGMAVLAWAGVERIDLEEAAAGMLGEERAVEPHPSAALDDLYGRFRDRLVTEGWLVR